MNPSSSPAKPTLDQRRAKHAWNAVLRAKSGEGAHKDQNDKQFGRNAKKLPVRIVASGLGQSLAFLKAKGKAPGLVAELSDWIAVRIPTQTGESRDLLERVIHGKSDFLRRATDEVLAYLQWLTRFAEAEGLTEGDDT